MTGQKTFKNMLGLLFCEFVFENNRFDCFVYLSSADSFIHGKIIKISFSDRFLVTESLDCHLKFNGLALSDVITLNSSQYIPGTTTFRNMEVTETLEVN